MLRSELEETDEVLKAQLELYRGELAAMQEAAAEESAALAGVMGEVGEMRSAGLLGGWAGPDQAAAEAAGVSPGEWQEWSRVLLALDELLLLGRLKEAEVQQLREMARQRSMALWEVWGEVRASLVVRGGDPWEGEGGGGARISPGHVCMQSFQVLLRHRIWLPPLLFVGPDLRP